MVATMPLSEAAEITRTGDIWLFRGRSAADRAIRAFTNAPVNHVAMAMAIDDLPPLLWHAELGRSLPDVWTGRHQRGTQLHRLVDAVAIWEQRYGQQTWMRALDIDVSEQMEDALLGVIAELDGRAFPNTSALARGWLKGRARRPAQVERVFCAEVVAITLERMGLLDGGRPPNWYDPGKFWSGDHLSLRGASLGPEVAITDVPVLPAARG